MARIVFIFIVCFFSWAFLLAEAPFSLLNNEAKLPILTPSFSKQQVLKIKLANGLKACLISDPHLEYSGALLAVKVGSWSDPKKAPGMAHFLEHLLFLGTKKYPIESEYDKIISQFGGKTNGFTTPEATCFLFDVSHEGFKEAFDRFAQFFQDPLFNASGVHRELLAIDQEWAKNVQTDGLRAYYVLRDLAPKEHPFHAFAMGNQRSLSKIQQEDVKKWYETHYSSDRMQLVVYSTLSMEDLKKEVIGAFSAVSKRETGPNVVAEIFTIQKGFKQWIYVEPIQNIRTIHLSWIFPNSFSSFSKSYSKPWEVLSFLLGNRGKQSLLASLKERQLAERLDCYTFSVGPSLKMMIFEVDVTPLGQDKLDEVVEECFSFIEGVKKATMPPSLFQEIQKIQALNYQFQERGSLFDVLMNQASLLVEEPIEIFPEPPLLFEKEDPLAMATFLNYLTPKNCQFLFLSKQIPKQESVSFQEPWLKVPYFLKEISDTTWEKFCHPKPFLGAVFPVKNEYLPQDFSLVTEDSKGPELLWEDKKGKVYFEADTHYKIPKAVAFFTFLSPEIDQGDAKKSVLFDLFLEALDEASEELTYPAQQAGLETFFQKEPFGLTVQVAGFNEHLPTLLKQVLKQVFDLQLEETKFSKYKEILLRRYRDFCFDQPYLQAQELLKKALFKSFATPLEKMESLQTLSYKESQVFCQQVLKQAYMQGTLFGNLTKKRAKSLAWEVQDWIKEPFQPEKTRPEVILLSDQGPYFIQKSALSEGDVAFLVIQDETFNFSNRAAQQILAQLFKEPFYSALRTKQQTGYLVTNGAQEIERELFFFFLVQSHRYSAQELLTRYDLFLEDYLREIGKTVLLKKEFEVSKQSVLTLLRMPPKNPVEMAQKIHRLAYLYGADFQWMEKRAEACALLTYEECVAYAKKVLGRENRRRLALLVQGTPLQDRAFLWYPSTLEQLHKESRFQNVDANNPRF